MDAPKRWRCVLASIVSLHLWHLATSSSPPPHPSSSNTFRVRNVHGPREEHNDRQRKLFELQLTFSKEGEPLLLPIYQLQVFPTPLPIDSDSALSMDAALGDFFKQYFDAKYPNVDGDDDDTVTTDVPQFDSVLVETINVRTITSESKRTRRRLQRQGTEFDIRTTLRFEDGVFPEYSQIKQDLQLLFDDVDSFVSDYLPAYTTTALEQVDTVTYIPGFTDAPTTSPTTSPTASPSGDSTTPRNGTVSEINQTAQANDDNGRLDAIYPALICGVVVFILTALWLAHRRNRVADIDVDDYSAPIEHISVDYDGRQEAMDLAKERQREHQKEQERLEQFQNEEIARRLRASRQGSSLSNQAWLFSGNTVQSERMEDGRTTIHISPETYGGDYDYDDGNMSEITQGAVMNTSSSAPLILDMASLSDDSMFIDPPPSTGIFCAAGNSGLFGGSSPKPGIKFQRHASMPNTKNDVVESASMDSI